jgi:hypothetical protein
MRPNLVASAPLALTHLAQRRPKKHQSVMAITDVLAMFWQHQDN